ncbi:hypothetical protein [Staphylococcus phage vB_StaM_PB50]|nr:hypothetical protein [Staphylococcus phage vB_StaM_PB50]
MKYYKLNKKGMSEVLGIHGSNNIIDIFKSGYIYLTEDEEIPFYNFIEKDYDEKVNSIDISNKGYEKGKACLIIDKKDNDIPMLYSININLKDTKMCDNELFKIIKRKLVNDVFSFTNFEKIGVKLLKDIHYIEISKKEYYQNKVKENFK